MAITELAEHSDIRPQVEADGDELVTLADLSESEAEKALVQIWLLLEKHEIASPKVVVLPILDHLRIRLLFASRSDADLLRRKLDGLGRMASFSAEVMSRGRQPKRWQGADLGAFSPPARYRSGRCFCQRARRGSRKSKP
jgi:hypothetical protein